MIFQTAFDEADRVVLAEIYAAREKNIYKISSKTPDEQDKRSRSFEGCVFLQATFEEIANFVYNNAEEGDLVLTDGCRRHIQGR